eukprot:CAMPEP_0174236522 /NCGR_PEP_ID=MMETSP0417-20130205/5634_1 /TAXON_ID=242541 /ORGANISM="Mayorella sp, Strain BSH-02190019" /LENGTH=529 /DNA_ID=CAMNT_0015315183 /DNA_START=23 /DNA_END=1608 /DNA_ORIENTATION=+
MKEDNLQQQPGNTDVQRCTREGVSTAEGADSSSSSSAVRWTAELDAELFDAIEHFPPYGMHRRVNVTCIAQRLEHIARQPINPSLVWERISHYYHLDALKSDSEEELDSVEEFALPTGWTSSTGGSGSNELSGDDIEAGDNEDEDADDDDAVHMRGSNSERNAPASQGQRRRRRTVDDDEDEEADEDGEIGENDESEEADEDENEYEESAVRSERRSSRGRHPSSSRKKRTGGDRLVTSAPRKRSKQNVVTPRTRSKRGQSDSRSSHRGTTRRASDEEEGDNNDDNDDDEDEEDADFQLAELVRKASRRSRKVSNRGTAAFTDAQNNREDEDENEDMIDADVVAGESDEQDDDDDDDDEEDDEDDDGDDNDDGGADADDQDDEDFVATSHTARLAKRKGKTRSVLTRRTSGAGRPQRGAFDFEDLPTREDMLSEHKRLKRSRRNGVVYSSLASATFGALLELNVSVTQARLFRQIEDDWSRLNPSIADLYQGTKRTSYRTEVKNLLRNSDYFRRSSAGTWSIRPEEDLT